MKIDAAQFNRAIAADFNPSVTAFTRVDSNVVLRFDRMEFSTPDGEFVVRFFWGEQQVAEERVHVGSAPGTMMLSGLRGEMDVRFST